MLPTPKRFTLAAGAAEGDTRLTAFDKALLRSGLGNLNLIRVSSVLPPLCEYAEDLPIPPGSLTPTAYGALISDQPGEQIAAAVGVGISPSSFGMIMEYSDKCLPAEAEEAVRAMVREAFEARKMELAEIKVRSAGLTVERVGCVFAAVALWY